MPSAARYVWVEASNGYVPPNAISGGSDHGDLYIARIVHGNIIIPGKLVPSSGVCYVALDGGEYAKPDYEVLCGPSTVGHWSQVAGTEIPSQAIPGGANERGEEIYIGRVRHNGRIVIGKVIRGQCFISYGGREEVYSNFEVFVAN